LKFVRDIGLFRARVELDGHERGLFDPYPDAIESQTDFGVAARGQGFDGPAQVGDIGPSRLFFFAHDLDVLHLFSIHGVVQRLAGAKLPTQGFSPRGGRDRFGRKEEQ
jgi:hypothetical protein